ncbi:hypothetical protein BDV26DRAFT_44448 [Aspergillus bertholletiae]|uniref:Uncharacterized protein n=1 Tax=Aspergillus bertholletiae TaxID=1226010 RepID=A0A5N7AWV7_9EURO|nr:hypothetical protein BDV26DRAFT_44448 [Aspergillus bertholletiae]
MPHKLTIGGTRQQCGPLHFKFNNKIFYCRGACSVPSIVILYRRVIYNSITLARHYTAPYNDPNFPARLKVLDFSNNLWILGIASTIQILERKRRSSVGRSLNRHCTAALVWSR